MDIDPSVQLKVAEGYTHFAFTVHKNQFDDLRNRVKESGVIEWKENRSEGESFYFLDPDGHKLELHVGDWKSRLESVRKNPWEPGIEIFD